jgi:hypothetical protein
MLTRATFLSPVSSYAAESTKVRHLFILYLLVVFLLIFRDRDIEI